MLQPTIRDDGSSKAGFQARQVHSPRSFIKLISLNSAKDVRLAGSSLLKIFMVPLATATASNKSWCFGANLISEAESFRMKKVVLCHIF